MWQNTRSPLNKTYLNRLAHNLRLAIRQAWNDTFKLYTVNLTSDDHSLWKATKNSKDQQWPYHLQLGTLKHGKIKPIRTESCKSFHTTSQEQ